MVKGDARLFSDLLTSTGLDFVKTYAQGITATLLSATQGFVIEL